VTPKDLRQLAEIERVKAQEALAKAEAYERWARELEGLQPARTDSIIPSMDIDTRGMPAAVRKGAGRSTRKHVGLKRLYEAGVTVSALATELGETRARVSSWFAEGSSNRPIPARHAEYLQRRYGVPRSVWARVAE
jgi:hypothetical protein